MKKKGGVFLKIGHYYLLRGSSYKGSSYRAYKATLCIFCNGRCVKNYNKCLFIGRGQIKEAEGSLHCGCIDQQKKVIEITETEYDQRRLQQMIEEVL